MNWIELWKSKSYQELKIKNFNNIDNFINFVPNKILDIGCGFAFESEMFQKKYNSELFLLDSNYKDESNKSRQVSYGNVDNFSFYNKIDDLKESYNYRKMNYTFIDSNNLDIVDAKFDLIYSFLSCGFHYPAITYKDFIKEHTTTDTIIILDLRKNSINDQKDDIIIIEEIYESSKHITAQIRYK